MTPSTSLARASMSDPARKQLVGLLTADPALVLEEGSQIVAERDQPMPKRLIGHVTSSYASATLGRSMALALVSGGRARMGETLYVPTEHGEVAITVVSPVFYDAEGARVNA